MFCILGQTEYSRAVSLFHRIPGILVERQKMPRPPNFRGACRNASRQVKGLTNRHSDKSISIV